MAFDAGMLACVIAEIREKSLGARVEKVFQPERDEIVLQMRSLEGGKRLLINAGSNNPRVCFTTEQKENPMTPPMLCMLLRKHLQGAKLSDVRQEGFERVVTMEFETENGTHTLTLANGFFRIDGKYYESKTPIPELSDGEACHAFVTYTGRSELYINGAKMQIQNGLIDKIHFRLVEGVMVQPELIGGTYLLTFDYEGKIELYSARYFVYDGNLYEVVGTADFSQIFEEYPRTEDGYKTLCENCRKTDEGSIYRQEYGANLCDGCYQEFEEVIMLPCCFCGSYVCNGCQG